ncbi:MAG: hypothetical protein IKY90_06045 [Oscillospiraceae bacterium]|nr:hypothetical protein [Oscillospiraceae bacterium]
MYQYLDEQLTKAKKKLRTEFNRLSVTGFDELNVVNTRKITKDMFDRLLSDNEKMYLKVAKKAYSAAGGNDNPPNEEWLVGVLAMYNLVTGYLYKSEAERKRLRLNEQILTAREYASRQMYNDSLRKTANLWYTQTMQYGISVVDEATLKAYKDMGIKEVEWVSMVDGKECKDCASRNGKIYKITEVPEKSHYGCRCYLRPVKNKE